MAEDRSPEDWLRLLRRRLDEDRPTMHTWWRYFVGDHPYPGMPDKIRERVWERYLPILRRSRSNFMAMVIDAQTERLRPTGFRLGADGDFQTDQEAWTIWQASNMDADAPLAIETCLAKGRSYLSVWHHEGEAHPRIAAEDPSQVIVAYEPGSRHRRAAALKIYSDDWGVERAEVFLPEGVYHFVAKPGQGLRPLDGDEFTANPFNIRVVPIVPLINRPRLHIAKLEDHPWLRGGGESEIADVTSIQDRINATILAGEIAQWFAAFKQRWATGLVIDEEPVLDSEGNPVLNDDGSPKTKPIEPFDVFLDRMLVVGDGEVKFGEFGATDLEPYLRMRERDLQDLSTIKRTPRHYLFHEGQSPSGDAIKSAETGLVARVRRKMLDLGESFEEAVRIARAFQGKGVAAPDSEIVWADPEYRTYGELVDGVIKEVQAGLLPWEGALEKIGYTPQQIARYRAMRAETALFAALENEDPEQAA